MRLPEFIRRYLPKVYIQAPPMVVVDIHAFESERLIDNLDDFLSVALKLCNQARYQWVPSTVWKLVIHPDTFDEMRIQNAMREGRQPLGYPDLMRVAGAALKLDADMPKQRLRVVREPTVFRVPA